MTYGTYMMWGVGTNNISFIPPCTSIAISYIMMTLFLKTLQVTVALLCQIRTLRCGVRQIGPVWVSEFNRYINTV